jgi:MOSC domain-containing protein YiiM
MSARVESLHLHERHGEKPRQVAEAIARVGGGLEGDSHVAKVKRAVIVVDRGAEDALGLVPGDLREQITITGLPDVSTLPPGTELRVGAVTLRINGECVPCEHLADLNDQPDTAAFRAALEHRRGAECTVVAAAGPVRVGDVVRVLVRA